MKTTLQKAWKYIDGNKTIIFNTTAGILSYGVQNHLLNNSNGIQWTIGICFVIGGASLGHHIKKGFFTTKKGS